MKNLKEQFEEVVESIELDIDYYINPIIIKSSLKESIEKCLSIADAQAIEFTTWVQDNYSQDKISGQKMTMLPKRKMRRDFTSEVYTIKEILARFKQEHYGETNT
jgi:hypothetical protein